MEALEDRTAPSAAHDIVGLTTLRADPTYAAMDGRLPTGQRIGVAVIDSGVYANHQDLRDHFLVYYDAIANSQSTNVTAAQDPNGHGTHVAGIVLGGFSSQRQDTIGVAPQAGLVAIRGLPSEGEPQPRFDPVLASLNWVQANYAQYNIKVVNMSLGYSTTNFNSGQPDDDLGRVIHALERLGITVVSASGNEFAHFDQLGQSSPAVFSTLSVGNTLPASLSGAYGSGGYNPSAGVDFSPTADEFNVTSQRSAMANQVAAPGSFIVSTYKTGGYETMGGTSQASPLVAGAVALMQDAAQTFGGRYLSPDEVRAIIRSSADTIVDRADPNTLRGSRDLVQRVFSGQADRSQLSDLHETGQSFFRINIQRAIQQVRASVTQGGGGGTTSPDTNNVTSRAIQLPPLNGSSTFGFEGRIGPDGQVAVGNNDVDLFQLVLETRGALSIRTEVIPGGTAFNAFLRLFDTNGNQIGFNDNADGTTLYPALQTGTLAAGTYYVGLSSFNNAAYNVVTGAGSQNGGSAGDYRVTVTTINPDPNGVIQGAAPIDLTSPNYVWPPGSPPTQAGIFVADKITSEIYSDPHPLYDDDPTRYPPRLVIGPTDVDIFKIVAPDNGRLFVDVEAQNVYGVNAVDSFVKVFRLEANGSLTVVGENDDESPFSTDSFVGVDVGIGRTYYVALTTFGNRNFNPFDPNNRTSSTNQTGLMDTYLSFTNGDVNGSAYANVSLNGSAFDPDGDGLGTFPGAIGTDFGTSLLGANGGFKDVDFLRLTVQQTGALQVNVTSPDGTLNSVLGIWQLTQAQDNIVQVVAGRGDNPGARFEVTAGQTIWISITGQGNGGFNWAAPASGTGGDTGNYQLTTAFLTQAQFRSLTNDSVSFNTPTPIVLGGSVVAAIGMDDISFTGADDVDMYVFQPTTSQAIDIRTGGDMEGKADTFLRVFDNSGNEIAFNDNATGTTSNSFVRLNVQAGRTYYIGVNGASANARNYSPLTGAGAAAGSQGEYVVTVEAAAAAPEIDVVGNNVSILNGDATPSSLDHTDFGSANVAGGTVTRTFTIANVSTGILSLTGSPLVQVSGANAGDFTVTVLPTPSVNAGGTTTFQVTFDPSASGTRTATISIANTDADENPYNFSIQGSGSVPPNPAPKVTGTQVNGGAAQRSMVTSISVTFSTVVTLPANVASAFTLARIGGGLVTIGTATAQTVSGATVVMLSGFSGAEASFGGSLNDGRYTLTALATQITANGQQLDGNGDGTAGDNFTFGDSGAATGNQLYRFLGDITGDRFVNGADFALFRTAFGSSSGNANYNAAFDVNGDGFVNGTDFAVFRTNFGGSI